MPFTPQRRTPAKAGQPVSDPANWTAAGLGEDRSWIHELTEGEVADLRAAGRAALDM